MYNFDIINFNIQFKVYERLKLDPESLKADKHEVDLKPKNRSQFDIKNKFKPIKANTRCYNYCGSNHNSINSTVKILAIFVFDLTITA